MAVGWSVHGGSFVDKERRSLRRVLGMQMWLDAETLWFRPEAILSLSAQLRRYMTDLFLNEKIYFRFHLLMTIICSSRFPLASDDLMSNSSYTPPPQSSPQHPTPQSKPA